MAFAFSFALGLNLSQVLLFSFCYHSCSPGVAALTTANLVVEGKFNTQ